MKKIFSKTIINLIWIIINILFAIIAAIFYESQKLYLILSYIGVLQLVVSIYLNCKREEKLFSALTIFNVVTYVFLYGQCIMWIITEEYVGRNIIEVYTKEIIIKTQVFTLVSLFVFNLGIFNVSINKTKEITENRQLWLKSARIFGYVLLIFSALPEIVYNIRIFLIASQQGYLGIYNNQVQGIFSKFLTLREFFFPAVILILATKSDNKILNRTLIGIIILDIIVGLYVGTRSDALMQAIALLLLIFIIKKDFSKKTIFKYGIILVSILIVINAVRTVRTLPDKNLKTFIEAMTEESKNGIITQTLGEMGTSMSTCIETITLVPEQYSYRYGTTYLYSLTWIIPGYLTNNISQKASMNNWLGTVRYTGSGWGFSTTAEAYINFGYYGVIVFLAIGIFVGKIFGRIDRKLYETNPIEFALSFMLFARLLIFARIDFLSTLPSIFYFYICMRIGIKIVYYYLSSKENDNEIF